MKKLLAAVVLVSLLLPLTPTPTSAASTFIIHDGTDQAAKLKALGQRGQAGLAITRAEVSGRFYLATMDVARKVLAKQYGVTFTRHSTTVEYIPKINGGFSLNVTRSISVAGGTAANRAIAKRAEGLTHIAAEHDACTLTVRNWGGTCSSAYSKIILPIELTVDTQGDYATGFFAVRPGTLIDKGTTWTRYRSPDLRAEIILHSDGSLTDWFDGMGGASLDGPPPSGWTATQWALVGGYATLVATELIQAGLTPTPIRWGLAVLKIGGATVTLYLAWPPEISRQDWYAQNGAPCLRSYGWYEGVPSSATELGTYHHLHYWLDHSCVHMVPCPYICWFDGYTGEPWMPPKTDMPLWSAYYKYWCGIHPENSQCRKIANQ